MGGGGYGDRLPASQIFSEWLKSNNSAVVDKGSLRFSSFLACIKLWALAVDHSKRIKRFTDEVALFTRSGTLPGLKVRHEHPPRVTPQLDTNFKLN